MLEKYPGFHLNSPGLSDFTASSSQNQETSALQAMHANSE